MHLQPQTKAGSEKQRQQGPGGPGILCSSFQPSSYRGKRWNHPSLKQSLLLVHLYHHFGSLWAASVWPLTRLHFCSLLPSFLLRWPLSVFTSPPESPPSRSVEGPCFTRVMATCLMRATELNRPSCITSKYMFSAASVSLDL